jgi:large subunit ribosomal protein L31
MKKGLHPDNYRPVVFQDLNNNWSFLTKSTATTEETIKWDDGNTYPLVKVHISSASHPFFTGQEKLVDIEGRVDKFKARAEAAKAAREAKAAKKPRKSESKNAAQKLGARDEAMKARASKSRVKQPKADETQKIGSLKPKAK